MKGKLYKDTHGQMFEVTFVDHNMNGSWVHYKRQSDGKEFNCLIDAFKSLFQPVENTR